MNNPQPQYDDEIDLFELMQTIWEGKAWVILATLISTGLGGLYISVTTKVYEISISAMVHADAGAGAEILQIIQQNSDLPWTINSRTKTLTVETKAPLEPKKYTTDIKSASERTKASLLRYHEDELNQIFKLPPLLLQTEAVANTVLRNQRFINRFKTEGEEIASFASPVESVKSPKIKTVLALTFILGGMLGVLGVLVKSAYRNRAKKA